MTLQSGRMTSISVTPVAVIADNDASHGTQDVQTPQQTQELQEGHMPAVLHLPQQRPYAPYPQQFQQLDGRQLILQFFRNMVQAQQHTEILRKGVEGIHDRKQRQQAGGPMWRSKMQQRQQAGGLMQHYQMRQRQKATPYQMQDIPTCQFCKKKGHIPENCRRRLRLCLLCGSSQHHARGCSKQHDTTKMVEHPEDRVDQLPAPGEYPSRRPLPDQASQFEEARKKKEIQRAAKQRAQHAFTMASKKAQTSVVVDAGPFQHPSVSVDVLQPAS